MTVAVPLGASSGTAVLHTPALSSAQHPRHSSANPPVPGPVRTLGACRKLLPNAEPSSVPVMGRRPSALGSPKSTRKDAKCEVDSRASRRKVLKNPLDAGSAWHSHRMGILEHRSAAQVSVSKSSCDMAWFTFATTSKGVVKIRLSLASSATFE